MGSDSQPQAVRLSPQGHLLPRRSPSTRLSPPRKPALAQNDSDNDGDAGSSVFLRRNSSDESHETGQSDPRVWFDRSNKNPDIDVNSMEVGSPYYQKRPASPRDDYFDGDIPPRAAFPGNADVPSLRPATAQSSSADEFRSVIDDLTIENKRLKEELKRYKQFGTDLMRKDRLFEIKMHGLPSKKKRELEATLRDFASTLEGSTETSTRHKKSKSGSRFNKSSGGTTSKHASSSSSNSRPVDSAYASMSTGPSTVQNSHTSASLLRRPHTSQRSNAQKVQSYLEDIPEGLYPRYLSMTEKDKQKLVVRRLEQLFTGEMNGPAIGASDRAGRQHEPALDAGKPSDMAREALIQIRNKFSREIGSSNSNGDSGSGSGGGHGASGGGSGNGGRDSPQEPSTASEQRPTRPLDLDPDRVQVPSENMDYIRHLGMVPPQLDVGAKVSMKNVSMDANGWVYLNLLCNLAQLHIINVTPAFIRAAVSEKSTRFQLSPDGHKIRWRGGTDGTRFSSDSGNASARDRLSDGDDSSDKSPGIHGQKRKFLAGGDNGSGLASNKAAPGSSTSVHYKPLFVQQSSFGTSGEMSSSQASGPEDSNFGNTSKWDYSGSGSSPRKKRRVDGAIVYYSGMPFCTDLSGDPGDVSPTTNMTSTNRETGSPETAPRVFRTLSGSSLPYRPLSSTQAYTKLTKEAEEQASCEDDLGGDIDFSSDESEDNFGWHPLSTRAELETTPLELEACGLGGVQPDDHFVIVVSTRRHHSLGSHRHEARPHIFRERSGSTTATILERFKLLKAASPGPMTLNHRLEPAKYIEYTSTQVKMLDPVPLPPPAMFMSPFSAGSSDNADVESESEPLDSEEPDALPSGLLFLPYERPGLVRADSNLAYPDGGEISPSDEEGEDSENPSDGMEIDSRKFGGPSRERRRSKGNGGANLANHAERRASLTSDSRKAAGDARTQSSVATAGGAGSGYDSSMEE
ncbi:hypothetical protein RB595_007166 [Gaeumannomyces hyphopodioides]